MNQKGLAVLETIINQGLAPRVAFLCLGKDKSVQNDYSAEILEAANKAGIKVIERKEPCQHTTSDSLLAGGG